jgi:hypothetical protein
MIPWPAGLLAAQSGEDDLEESLWGTMQLELLDSRTWSRVVGFDETVLRAGPAGTKRYVLSASTDRYALFHLGGRDLDSF